MSEARHMTRASRRGFLVHSARLAAGVGLVSLLAVNPSRATPESMQDAIRKVVLVAVDSPMTEADHVRAIHVFNEKNPQPHVVTVGLGPRAGRAKLSTRIKLSGSQRIVAVAEMSDGSFWTESADIIVTIAACIEDMP
jgi:sulfur-oxidizing protein SoxY